MLVYRFQDRGAATASLSAPLATESLSLHTITTNNIISHYSNKRPLRLTKPVSVDTIMTHDDMILWQVTNRLEWLKNDIRRPEDSTLDGSTQEVSLPLRLKTESTGGYNSTENTEGSPITLKSLPGRGVGVVATRFIPSGSIILQEDAIMTLPGPPATATPALLFGLVEGYIRCKSEVRQRLLSLHACPCPGLKDGIRKLFAGARPPARTQLTEEEINFVYRLYSIFTTNTFDDTTPSHCSLFLEASRFNHSCLPNCDYGHISKGRHPTITIRTVRDIQPDEELTLTYLINHEPRDKRRADTKRSWGFECNCPACDVADPRVDTAAHEHMLEEYRRLKRDPYLEACETLNTDTFSIKDLDEALDRSLQRTRIVQALGDNYVTMQQYVLPPPTYLSRYLFVILMGIPYR